MAVYNCYKPLTVPTLIKVYFSVLQLVKAQKMHAKLVIVVETEKEKILRKEFVFDDRKVMSIRQLVSTWFSFTTLKT